MHYSEKGISCCLWGAKANLLIYLFFVSNLFGEGGRVSFGKINQCEDANNGVSMVALLSDPERFDGQCVIVEGVVILNGLGDNRLYLNKEAAEYMIQHNSLYLSFGQIDFSFKEYKVLDGRYVRMQGVVKTKTGESGKLLFKGISDINYIALSNVEQAKLERVRVKTSGESE